MENLGPLARPVVPEVIRRLLADNPKSSGDVYTGKRLLSEIGMTEADLAPLLASENPWVVVLAAKVIEDAKMNGAIATTALERLRAVSPRITGQNESASVRELESQLWKLTH